MTDRAAAIRYARALFDVVTREKGGDPARAEQELVAFTDVVRQHEPLARLIDNPAFPAPRKRAIVQAIVDRTKPSAPVSKLALLLAERDRLAILPDLVEAYRSRLLDHQRIVRAEVTTAVPLPEDRRAALERGLAQATGRTVTLAAKVEPAIIGGAVTRMGSVVYDGSVRRQLEKLRDTLSEA
jgi:F-type H+-transporting ATPase subunit delta